MQGFYIFLVAAGAICVVLSFILSEKIDNIKNGSEIDISEEMLTLLLKKSEKLVDASMQSYLEDNKYDVIEKTRTELNQLCNEKIMAVDEFSDTVLEKIHQNHSEVIFLYNMLNEKEEELKDLLAQVNVTVKNKKPSVTKEAKLKEEKVINHSESKMQDGQKGSSHKSNEGLSETEKNKKSHTREEILAMYEDGDSVTDIAQKLKMGKGEVKLIIDLYQGAKR